MSKADDFYGSPAWDEAAQAELPVRIKRVPKTLRLRRYANKAWALFYKSDGDPVRRRAAIALIERGVAEHEGRADDAAHELITAATYAVELGDLAKAIELARRSIALEPRPFIHGLVTAQELLARCLTDTGDPGARAAWDDFYRHRETVTEGRWKLPPYDELAARELAVRDPDEAAEGIPVIYEFAEDPEPAVPGIVDANLASLEALDRHYRVLKRSCERRWAPRAVFKEEYLLDTHLPQLGAYVGRVLVRTAGARWQVAAPLMHSRVLLGPATLDPFRAAYDAIYYEASLADFVTAAGRPAPSSGRTG